MRFSWASAVPPAAAGAPAAPVPPTPRCLLPKTPPAGRAGAGGGKGARTGFPRGSRSDPRGARQRGSAGGATHPWAAGPRAAALAFRSFACPLGGRSGDTGILRRGIPLHRSSSAAAHARHAGGAGRDIRMRRSTAWSWSRGPAKGMARRRDGGRRRAGRRLLLSSALVRGAVQEEPAVAKPARPGPTRTSTARIGGDQTRWITRPCPRPPRRGAAPSHHRPGRMSMSEPERARRTVRLGRTARQTAASSSGVRHRGATVRPGLRHSRAPPRVDV